MTNTPTLRATIRQIVEEELLNDMLFALPGKVTAYDVASQMAEVQPLVKRRVAAENGVVVLERRAIVTHVPVISFRAGAFRMIATDLVGETGLLLFTSASLDEWIAIGGEVAPADARRQAPSDAVFIPGLRSRNNPSESADNPVIGYPDAQIEFTTSEIRAGGSEPLVTRAEFLAHGHATAGTGAPSAPITVTPPGSSVTFPGTSKLRG